MRRSLVLAALAVAAIAFVPSQAQASPYVRYGIQDDAWLEFGPGSLEDRLDRLQDMGVEVSDDAVPGAVSAQLQVALHQRATLLSGVRACWPWRGRCG